MRIKVYKSFERKFSTLLGEDYKRLVECLETGVKNCIRVNTLKIDKDSLKEKLERRGWQLEEVPWYENAFFVKADNISRTVEHSLGYYFIQDASSLVPPLVLNPSPADTVLDLCAAPGSKTTFIAELMENKGLLIANDVNAKRLKALTSNLQRMGVTNTVVMKHDGRSFFKKGLKFDKILVDASCSGSGTIASTPSSLLFWNEKVLRRLQYIQKDLLMSAARMLTDEGEIVYSTCSIDPEEDELVVDFAVRFLGLKTERIDVKGLVYRRGIESYGRELAGANDCIRFYPFDNKTEGFFVCKLKK
jgi:NOL1/NOP2/sun family putative RNA methylase